MEFGLSVGCTMILYIDQGLDPHYLENHLAAVKMQRSDGSTYEVPITTCTWCEDNVYRLQPTKSDGSAALCKFYTCDAITDVIYGLMFNSTPCDYRIIRADLCFVDFSKPETAGYYTERRPLAIAPRLYDKSPPSLCPHYVDIDRSCASKCDVYNLFGISVENLKERPDLREDAYRRSIQTVIYPFGQVTIEWADGFGTLNAIGEYLMKYKPKAYVGLTKDYMVAMATFTCRDITGFIKTDKVWHDLHTIRVSFAMTSDGHRIIDWVSPI